MCPAGPNSTQKAYLEALGYRVKVIYLEVSSFDKGLVQETSPAKGSKVEEGGHDRSAGIQSGANAATDKFGRRHRLAVVNRHICGDSVLRNPRFAALAC